MSGSYDAPAKEKETPQGLVRVSEGFATVLFLPPNTSKQRQQRTTGQDEEDQSIFYNPAQVVNRDLSVCMIETFAKARAKETRRRGGVGEDGITILEALSATGLRALRYWKEIKGVKSIVANDLDPEAVDAIKRNCEFNEAPLCESLSQKGIIPNCDDAITLMQRLGLDQNLPYRLCAVDKTTGSLLPEKVLLQSEKVDVVDLDPYGTASPFLDSAMQCAKEGALMLVTCTDSSILCGNYPETCFAKYGAFSTRIDSCHEVATRIVLGLIESTANRHRKFIQPLLSLHIDFYVRVFVRVWTQPAEVKRACVKLANLFHCTRCPFFKVSPLASTKMTRKQAKKTPTVAKRGRDGVEEDENEALPEPCVYPTPAPRDEIVVTQCASTTGFPTQCEACGSRVLSAGPIYAAPTHDREFLEQALITIEEKASEGRLTAVDRIKGLVCSARDELPDAPLFYDLPEVASACGIHCPPTAPIVAALARMGYACSQVHCKASGVKTTAPPRILFGVLKHYSTAYPQPSQPSVEKKPPSEKHGEANRKKTKDEYKITIKYPEVPCDLTYDKDFDWRSRTTGIVKFVPNAPFWGPKRRHQGVKKDQE